MKTLRSTILLGIVSLFITQTVFSQDLHEAPSLQIGLSGISLSKGNLDPTIIAEIIGEKQEELKVKLIKNMLLKQIKVDNALFYGYVDNTIDIITTEKDEEVRMKNLLENTVNLAFVVSYADYYVRRLEDKKKIPGNNEYNEFFDLLRCVVDSADHLDITPLKLETLSRLSVGYKSKHYKSKKIWDVESAELLNNGKTVDDTRDEANKFLGIFLDLVSEVIRQNEMLEERGVFRANYLNRNLEMNTFKALFNGESNNVEASEKAKAVFGNVKEDLRIHLKYFRLIKSMSKKGVKWSNVNETFSECNKDVSYEDLKKLLKEGRDELNQLKEISDEEFTKLVEVTGFLDQARHIENNRDQYLGRYEEEIKPLINSLSVRSEKFIELRDLMSQQTECITNEAESDFNKIGLDLNLPFINILGSINEFEKPKTYARFLDYASNAGEIFSDIQMRNSINRILTFIRGYIKISETEEGAHSVVLDVEGFLSGLQNLPYNRARSFEPIFTVGTNTLFFQEPMVTDSGSLVNYSYVSEKIGIKLKLWDSQYRNSFNKGEKFKTGLGFEYVRTAPSKEPTISNLHLLAYGSGILYNLANTGTSSNFNSPLVGVGVGITFMNDLDFNVSWGKAIPSNQKFNGPNNPTFINIGFDIQFTEYLARLNKRRKHNHTQKQLLKAAEIAKNSEGNKNQ